MYDNDGHGQAASNSLCNPLSGPSQHGHEYTTNDAPGARGDANSSRLINVNNELLGDGEL